MIKMKDVIVINEVDSRFHGNDKIVYECAMINEPGPACRQTGCYTSFVMTRE
ncbi:MAG: hypothetical protein ACD_2C00042G0002 [uncultured bacterium (gcode 4)]|uniref:Uncharacterized protein n=1 Tax=uncultured bacterium (gcode 4) TaxID=1234023 RepID=K2G4E0_9BACT|nr:MAG: hypothetical protein ACD_2C00042G0002 [uncultured bacterium (gcode 4)]